MPKPDSSLTFSLHATALELLIEHHGKWQRKLDLRQCALSHSYDSVKKNKFTEKFDPSVYSVPLVKCYQCTCHLTAKSQESKHGRKHRAMGSTSLQRAPGCITWSYCLELNRHLIAPIHLLSSAFLSSEGSQQRKSISAQLSALLILQTWLSLVVSK